MKFKQGVLFSLVLFLVAACQTSSPACPPESVTYLQDVNSSPASDAQESAPTPEQLVEINGQQMLVDKVVRGTLCSGSWSGTVYIPCQIKIYAWEEDPTFLENCDLSIAPGTIVYVAAHNDEPYYQGCSCHTGELDQ
jgi:hypothetical protein